MDDVIFSARRASAAAPARPGEAPDLDTRFRTLVQSPLRAGLLRYLSARPDEAFDVESLMQTFGRLRLDVDNCVRELVDFGVARIVEDTTPPRFTAEPKPVARPHEIRAAARMSYQGSILMSDASFTTMCSEKVPSCAKRLRFCSPKW